MEESLLLDLYEYQHALMSNAVFIPRIVTFPCQTCPAEIRGLHCIEGGLYCFTPPNEEIIQRFPDVDEREMLSENIREKCIFSLVDEFNDDDRHIFFNYLYNVRFTCLEPEGRITALCATQVM